MNIPLIPMDKQAHFWAGWASAATFFTLCGWLSIILAIAVAVLWEGYKIHRQVAPDWPDLVYQSAGAVIGAAACSILHHL